MLVRMVGGQGAPRADLEPGVILGPYRLESVLGQGGMGIVYLATHETSGHRVALKILRSELTGDETYRRRFLHEARAASQVIHPHLVPILDSGEIDGWPCLAARYVDGGSLSQRIREGGALPLNGVLRVAGHVGGAIDALHVRGLVHRDIKPSNIMLDSSDEAYLTDFGLAKGPAYTILTQPGRAMGTLDYLAPELIRGQVATAASDLYAFGCVMYECIAAHPPFAHRNALQVAMAHLDEDPPDPCADRFDVPTGLCDAFMCALAKDPVERPPTAMALVNLLRAASTMSHG